MSSAPQLSPEAAERSATIIPRHLRHTWDHEWLVVDGGNATVDITAFAARALGDALHLRLPAVGTWVEAGESCGRIESRTAVSNPYAPASGRVLEADTAPAGDPGVVNAVPCTGGRLFRPRVENIAGALSADAHAAHCAPTQGDRP
ncbi:Glycine cleavage system H protein [Streptomyces sp. enrichment culture]|uniref:glycine cleavage system protein GcvH n=1 Tax=Streptomyces sp. enrichment culture TaxID=1795815 RepID=UPI003F557710